MMPTTTETKKLWDIYHLPEKKRIHVQLVSDVALFIAEKLMQASGMRIDTQLLQAACLLHDIDKGVEKLPGERHPEGAVRILLDEKMDEVAQLVKYHSVHFIDNPETAPHTIEEKLLFLADKMVKYDIISVDTRFSLWLEEEDLPETEKEMLRRVYPKVKMLEQEIFTAIGIQAQDVAQLLRP